MFRKLIKNKKAQNTAEYAIVISLVVAGIIAMQTYAQRALQARVRDASAYLANTTRAIGATQQYEPYYLETSYTINTVDTDTKYLSNTDRFATKQETTSTRNRVAGGYEVYNYDIRIERDFIIE